MKKTLEARISRLKARKQELQEQMKALRANPGVRNKELKLDRLNDQVLAITAKTKELQHK